MTTKLMTNFTEPIGINFRSTNYLLAPELAKALCRIASFLQDSKPYIKLQRYDDWWEHDGLHFYKAAIDFAELFSIIRSPRSLIEAMPDDDNVCIGIAPDDSSWYLRFRIEWTEEGFDLQGKLDITVKDQLSERFRDEVARKAAIELKEQDAQSYYRSIRV